MRLRCPRPPPRDPSHGSRRASGGGVQPGPKGPGKRRVREGSQLRRSGVSHSRGKPQLAVDQCPNPSPAPGFRRRMRGFPVPKLSRPPGPFGPGYMPRLLARPGRVEPRSIGSPDVTAGSREVKMIGDERAGCDVIRADSSIAGSIGIVTMRTAGVFFDIWT